MFETLSSYKCRIGDFNLYGLDDNECEWFIPFNGVDGVFNGASSTLSTSTKVWTDGYFTNRAVHAGRTVKLTGYIHGDCFDDILTSWDRFKAHLPFREAVEFTTTLNGISRLMYVEYQGEPLISAEGNSLGKFSLTLVSRDALTYTPGDPLTGTTPLPHSEGGMTFPYNFKGNGTISRWQFTEHQSSGSVTLLTSGSGNPPVTIRFNGDVTNPQVLHVQSGKILAYAGRIAAGHYVLFDGQSRQVLIDGATPARGAATRLEWFTAQQGANTFQYSAERGEDTSTMTVSFREGWL